MLVSYATRVTEEVDSPFRPFDGPPAVGTTRLDAAINDAE